MQSAITNQSTNKPKKSLSDNAYYFDTDTMPIEEIMNHPEQHIIPTNLSIIKHLWSLNILAKQDGDIRVSHTFINLGILSKENEDILKEFKEKNKVIDETKPFITSDNAIKMPPGYNIYDDDEDVNQILELLSRFELQDIQRDGYMTMDQFHSKYTNIVKLKRNEHKFSEPNPEYYNLDTEEGIRKYLDDEAEFNRKYSANEPNYIQVFDKNKATKPADKYLKDYKPLQDQPYTFYDCYDKEEGKIFLSRKLYEAHMRYKFFVKENEESITIKIG